MLLLTAHISTRTYSLSDHQPVCCMNGSFMSGWFKHYFHILLRCATKMLLRERLGCPNDSMQTVTHSKAVLSAHSTQRDAEYTQVIGEVKPQWWIVIDCNCTLLLPLNDIKTWAQSYHVCFHTVLCEHKVLQNLLQFFHFYSLLYMLLKWSSE